MLKHYLTVSFRNLWKNRGQTAISIIGLAVALVVFTFCAFQWRHNMSYNRNYHDSERLFGILNEVNGEMRRNYRRLTAETLAKQFPEIEVHTAYYIMGPAAYKLCEVSDGEKLNYFEQKFFVWGDSSFFNFYGLKILAGSITGAPHSIIITESAAKLFYGTTDVTGRTFTDINDFHNSKTVYTIAGVMEDFPDNTWLKTCSGVELNRPETLAPSHNIYYYDGYEPRIKLKKGVDWKAFNRKLQAQTIKYQYGTDKFAEDRLSIAPITDVGVWMGKQSVTMALIMMMTGLLVLLIAFLNYVIFIFGRILTRLKECGIRKITGSLQGGLFTLFFVESLIACIGAGALSLLIAKSAFGLMKDTMHGLEQSMFLGFQLQYIVALMGVVALLCFFATYRLIRIPVIQSVQRLVIFQRNSPLRNIFIGFQIVICLLFIGGAWFLYRQSAFLEKNLSAGLSETEKQSIFNVHLSGENYLPVREHIISFMEQNPKVEIVNRNGMGLIGAWQLGKGRFEWDGMTEQQGASQMANMLTDANYAEMLNVRMKAGRFYTKDEPDKAVVNEAFEKIYGSNPVGQEIRVNYWDGMKTFLIVGVMNDIVNNSNMFRQDGVVLPCIYLPYPEGHANLSCYVKVSPDYRSEFPKVMKAELEKYVSAGGQVRVPSLAERIDSAASESRTTTQLTGVFSLISILITLSGMFASVALTTEKRRKEVAIRKINGATSGMIVWLFCRNYCYLLVVSALVAFPLLYLLITNWLTRYKEHIALEVCSFVGLFLVMAAFIGCVISGQVLRMSRIKPAEALKAE